MRESLGGGRATRERQPVSVCVAQCPANSVQSHHTLFSLPFLLSFFLLFFFFFSFFLLTLQTAGVKSNGVVTDSCTPPGKKNEPGRKISSKNLLSICRVRSEPGPAAKPTTTPQKSLRDARYFPGLHETSAGLDRLGCTKTNRKKWRQAAGSWLDSRGLQFETSPTSKSLDSIFTKILAKPNLKSSTWSGLFFAGLKTVKARRGREVRRGNR
jgi:hypothetical protein